MRLSILNSALNVKLPKNTFLVDVFTSRKEAVNFRNKRWKTFARKKGDIRIIKRKVYVYAKKKDVPAYVLIRRYY